jgi:hypothetical protein
MAARSKLPLRKHLACTNASEPSMNFVIPIMEMGNTLCSERASASTAREENAA